jgi:ribonuclease T2
MKLLKWMSAAVVMSSVLQTGCAVAAPTNDKDFNYYVLVLSWSPDFCATNAKAANTAQCEVGRKYGFVLHGLWPQHEKGYPESCSNERIPNNIKQKCDIFPTVGLCNHEWEKHGTCSNLGAAGYLDFAAKLKNSVVIPEHFKAPDTTVRTSLEKFKADFVANNTAFSNDSIAPYCSGSGRFLKEVFFCFDKDGKSRACSAEVLNRSAKSCAQKDGFVIRNVR